MMATGSPAAASAAISEGDGASGTPASGTAVNSTRVETKRPGPRRVCVGSEIDSMNVRARRRSPSISERP